MSKAHQCISILIKEARKRKGYTQSNVALALGHESYVFYSIIERGRAKIPISTIGQLIVILDLPEEKIKKLLIDEYKEMVQLKLLEGMNA